MKRRSKSKSARTHPIRKHGPLLLLASAILVGVVFAQGGLNNQTKKTPPKIDSISPSPVVVNKEFTVTGSGFTKAGEGASQRKVQRDSPGNWYQIKGGLHGPPADSADGKTLKFTLNLDSRDVPKNCTTETTGKKCQVPFKVVNGYGVPSNAKQIEIFIPELKPLIFSFGYTVDSPTNINIVPGASDVEVLKMKVGADAQNNSNIEVGGFAIQTYPVTLSINCPYTFNEIWAFEVESGRELGLGGMEQSWIDPAGCYSMFPFLSPIILPPGTEKTILIKMRVASTAQVGLQFGLDAGPDAYGSPGGYYSYLQQEPRTGSAPTITIVAP